MTDSMAEQAKARQTMVDGQVRTSDVTSYSVIDAMLWAPRERFMPESRAAFAYADAHAVFPGGQVALSPRVQAKMLQAARVRPDHVVLDVGCAAGLSAALLSRLAGAVVALESDPQLAERATSTLIDAGVENCAVLCGSLADGDPDHQPYDAILVNGGIERLPEALPRQLRDGGRLVAVMLDGARGECRVMTRSGDAFGSMPVFDATAPLLPGFEAERAFVF